ncbi:UBIQUITIN_CONJUGAT_2 domain-containing protein [Meloidogyne graminicola]|uniref:UBIQUITIN_CONJUGAT_2 domain-containing protein n=1 Tax=Meloidogyne graminicola TaxID=189291 RepID=A0A8S9ZVZ4_9BILA|nr:UBIQUITIN_CONJUGAT_2 domain-containing protein [Meloidogyne graminicola]
MPNNYSLTSSSNASNANAAAIRALQLELKSLQSQPIEGFKVVCDEANLFKWTVAIFGPPRTLYQVLTFPTNYPYSPPSMKFIQPVYHPNVYPNGELCISILHPPVDDPHSGELSSERWNPTQTVRTVLLSVISLLNEPNISSPANVDASVSYRKYIEEGDQEYPNIIRKQVDKSKEEARKDKVIVPETIEDYVVPTKVIPTDNDVIDMDEDYYDDGASDSTDMPESEHAEDSGQGDED